MTTLNGGAGDDRNGHNNEQRKNKGLPPQIDDAKNFLEKVKEAFRDKEGVYDRFVDIMKNFKHDRLNTGTVIKEVQTLFNGHDDLFVGFQNFLPAVGLATESQIREWNHQNGGGQNASNTTQQSSNGTTAGNTSHAPNTTDAQADPPDFNMAVTFICKIKQRFGSHRKIYQEFLSILQHFQTAAQENDTNVIDVVKLRIRALFRDHPDLLDQFDYFLPPLTAHFRNAMEGKNGNNNNRTSSRKRRAESDLSNQPDTKRRKEANGNNNNNNGSNGSVEPTKRETRSSRREKRRHHKKMRDSKLRKKTTNYADDDDEDVHFTSSDNEETDTIPSGFNSKDEHQGLKIFSKLRASIPDHLYKHILTLTQLYPMGLTEFSVVGKLICDALREHGYTPLSKQFQKELTQSKQSWFFRSRGQNYYEYLTNNQLLKSCKQVQSSYRELPRDVVQPRCSGRHPDAAKCLNDYFVSKPTGGEGGGHAEELKPTEGGRLKNQYNENLQKSEDDLFELDMMIATNDSARKRLEEIYKKVMNNNNNPSQNNNNNNNDDEIPPVERRAISRLYSEHGNKVINLLKKMPETTIPVVLKRLREKSNEWEALKNEMKSCWKAVAAKNYFKAHDFRYTIFKQLDTKRITLKNICKQIEERHAAKKKKIKIENEKDEDEDDDIDMVKVKSEKKEFPFEVAFDTDHHGTKRKIDPFQIEPDETHIASPFHSMQSMLSGNGVVAGVGLIGNATHDHIVKQMGAGLHVELGDYVNCERINRFDYRFVVYKRNFLRDCARFVLQHANTSEVGKSKKEKKLFAEILEGIFMDFFGMNISEQSTEFLNNDIDSDNEHDDDYTSPPPLDTSLSSANDSPDPISKIMQKKEVQNEEDLNQIVDIGDDEQVKLHLSEYFGEDKKNKSVLIYGNRTIYALFRYLHFLYARMHFAFTLCQSSNPLYNKVDSSAEMQRKYRDFLSHLSKLINGQIEEEMYEDECRKLLGLKSFQLFTIHKVIRNLYSIVCDFDTDTKLHDFYKLFLCMKSKQMTKENRAKYFVAASKIAQNESKRHDELYLIQYFDQKILCISLCDKYESTSQSIPTLPIIPLPITTSNNTTNTADLSISPALSSSVELNKNNNNDKNNNATESSSGTAYTADDTPITEDVQMNSNQKEEE